MTYYTVTPPLPCPYKQRHFARKWDEITERIQYDQAEFIANYRNAMRYGTVISDYKPKSSGYR